MKITYFLKIRLWFFQTVILAAFSTASIMANAINDEKNVWKKDSKMLVIVGNGILDTVDGSIMLDGLDKGDGSVFQRDIMKRTHQEIAEEENKAIEFFLERYGIDVFNQDGIKYTGFQLDPRAHPKVFYASDEHIGEAGWSLSMGGWGVFVVAPDGIVLGGEFEGMHVPFNTVILYADQFITREDATSFSYHLESDYPTSFDRFGTGAIKFRIFSEEFGEGFAMGSQMLIGLDPNNPLLFQNDARNIFIFSKRTKQDKY